MVSAHNVVLRLVCCLLGAGMFFAGLIGTVRQGLWKQ
jgi:hypothetical protein